MKKIHAHGKCFDSKDFENLVIGGQNDADTIRFVVPRIFAGEVDYSEWEWAIHYENKEGQGDTVALTSQQSSDNADNIWIDWTPSQTATQVSGKLLCQLYSIRTVGEEIRRFSFHTFSIYVDEWLNPDPITQALPSVMEQALEQMEKYNQDIQDAITAGKNAAVSEKNAAASAIAAALSETAAKSSETKAKTSESNSKTSETNAKKSEKAARASEESATAAASAAKTSETNAKTSETNAAASKEEAAKSASNASKSETKAKASEDAAKSSQDAAKKSEDNAKASETKSKASAELSERFAKGTVDGIAVTEGEGYQDSSKFYKDQAGEARDAAKTSESNSKTSETNAKKSEDAARSSKEAASAAASAAKTSEDNAKTSESNAASSEEAAAKSASNASKSEINAKASKDAAKTSETNAKTSEDNAKKSAERAEELAETFDSEQIKESINEIVSAFQLAKARGWHEPGEIFQWSSKKKRPERTLVCNGAGLSKTDPLFADLYAAIGTDFGESDDGTMFLLPDYIKCYNADGTVNPNVKGLFPRPTDNVDEIGVKEQDTIRNINGAIYPDRMAAWWDDMGACRSGCIEIAKTSNSNVGPLYDGTTTLAGIRINASWQVPTGQENKPYSIRGLYLIAY